MQGRVKLNRNTLNDTNGTVPRRRRSFTPSRLANLTVGKTLECNVTFHSQCPNDWMTKIEAALEGTEASNEQTQVSCEYSQALAVEHRCAKVPPLTSGSSLPSERDDGHRSSAVSQFEGISQTQRKYSRSQANTNTGKRCEVKVEGRYTRSNPHGRTSTTRSMSQSLNKMTAHKGFSCSVQFALCFCGDLKFRPLNKTKSELTPKMKNSKVSYLTKRDVSFKSTAKKHRVVINQIYSSDVQHHAQNRQKLSSSQSKKYGISQALSSDKLDNRYPLRPRRKTDSGCGLTVGESQHKVNEVKTVPARGTDRGAAKVIESCSRLMPHAGLEARIIERINSPRPSISNSGACVAPHCPNPRLLVQSGITLRRSGNPSCCTLCGDIKYSPYKKTNQVQIQPKTTSPKPKSSKERFKTRTTKTNIFEAPKKRIIWIGKYPQVKLCDVAKVCIGPLQDFCCVLPDNLTTKVVYCFKRDLGTGVWLESWSSNRHGSENADHLSGKEWGNTSNRPQRLNLNPRATANLTVSLGPDGGTSEGPTNPSASLSLGKRASWGTREAGMLDKDAEEDPGVRNYLIAAKRIRLGKSGKDAAVPLAEQEISASLSDLAVGSGVTMNANRRVAREPGISSVNQSCLDYRICNNGISDTPLRTHGGQRRDPGGSDSSQESSENGLFSLSSDEIKMERHSTGEEPEEQELSSCQRVIAYVRRLQLSCARTYVSWPFPKRDPPTVAPSGLFQGNETPATKPVQSLPGAVNCAWRTNVIPSCGTMDYSPSTNQQDNEKHREKRVFSSSSDRSSKAMSSLLPGVQDPLACLSLSHLEEIQKMVMVKVPTFFKAEAETDTTLSLDLASTPSPFGLSDTDTATTSSPKLLFSTPDNMYGFSPTPFSTPASSNKDRATETVAVSILAASSSLLFKHRNEVDSGPDSNSSRNLSETDAASSELSSPLPNSSPDSLNESFQSSQSSYLLPQEDVETEEQVHKEVGADRDWDDVEDFTHSLFCIPQLKEHDDTTAECGPWRSQPTKSREERLELETDDPTPDTSPGASTPTHSITGLLDQTQSYSNEEESEGVTKDQEECVEPGDQGYDELGQVTSSGVHSEPYVPPTDADDNDVDETGIEEGQSSGEEESVSSQGSWSPSKEEETDPEEKPAEEPRTKPLDELAAYEQDILIVDVIQDDPDLFGNLPEKSLLSLGPKRTGFASGARTTRVLITPPSKNGGSSWPTQKSLTTGAAGINGANILKKGFVTFKDEESSGRSWRPQSSSRSSPVHSNSCPLVDSGPNSEGQQDSNNNSVMDHFSERTQTTLKKTEPFLMPANWCNGRGSQIRNSGDSGDLRHATPKFDKYCRYYFSENLTCNHKPCWYLHLPKDGDEKFCLQTVLRFSNSTNPVSLQTAVAVFTGYYRSNPPGVYFTPHVLNTLLSALLKVGSVPSIVSVLAVSATHKILPNPVFLLSLFDHVRERNLHSCARELMHLTPKLVDAGLVLSKENSKRVLHSMESQHASQMEALVPVEALVPAPGVHRSRASNPPGSEVMGLDHAILEVELCTQLEDWSRMGAVFFSVCHSPRGLGELQRFSGCVAIALLTETKDRLAPPFVAFSDKVCLEPCEDGQVKTFLGRIGVSLMFRYHKNQQWAKGQRLVEALARHKVNYPTLKGLFGNEDGGSRCHLLTVATELFLRSGSVEGALNTLRDNEWFLSSAQWPCESADIVERTNVLVRLAEKTSHRDTLEVLTNLPGLKEPMDKVDASQYLGLFNSHLHACVEKQTLPVAADTLDFMLGRSLAADPPLLHTLLHKLGKQNCWLRARALFKRSLCSGYYRGVAAPPGSRALTVPCRLGEIELALAFEMLIALNAAAISDITDTPSCLIITLTRTGDCESEYLSAGSRLLSAAVIPNPKLTVRYQAVNSSQEQVFLLDSSSARRWLRQNWSWANEVWTHPS